MIPIPAHQPKLNAYITALNSSGGLTSMERYALDRFERRQNNRSGLTKFAAIYPLVGGDAARHKFNFMDARDANGAYRLTFAGTVTHGSTGMQGNGSTGYADTFFQPGATEVLREYGVYFYSRTNSQSAVKDWGHRGASVLHYVEARNASGNFRGTQYSTVAITVANSDSRGFFGWQRPDGSNAERLLPSGSVVSAALAMGGAIGQNIYLMAINNSGTAEEFSGREYAFFAITRSQAPLLTGQFEGLRDDVVDFQTLLGRQV